MFLFFQLLRDLHPLQIRTVQVLWDAMKTLLLNPLQTTPNQNLLLWEDSEGETYG